jgi:hypothetical protein
MEDHAMQEFRLTRSEARNPAVYRDMKDRAAKAGQPLQIVADPVLGADGQPIQEVRTDLDLLDVAFTRDTIYVKRSACRDHREYRRISDAARTSNRRLSMIERWDDLPADQLEIVRELKNGVDRGALNATIDPLDAGKPA